MGIILLTKNCVGQLVLDLRDLLTDSAWLGADDIAK